MVEWVDERLREWRSAKPTRRRLGFIQTRRPGFFFWLASFYLLILILLLIGRAKHWFFLDQIPATLGGFLPLGVPWFGALGGVTIVLYGVFEHSHEWDPRWNYWHLARPFVGAILATIGYLIFIGLINATGATPVVRETSDTSTAEVTTNAATNDAAEAGPGSESKVPQRAPAESAEKQVLKETDGSLTSAPTTAPPAEQATEPNQNSVDETTEEPGTGNPDDLVPYYILAFLLGFREKTFRELIKRAVDILFGPGIPGVTPPAGLSLSPAPLDFGDVQVGETSEKTITASNVGSGNLFVNRRDEVEGGLSILPASGHAPAAFAAVNDISGSVIPPGALTSVRLQFKPTDPGEHKARLVIRSNAGVGEVELAGTAIDGPPAKIGPSIATRSHTPPVGTTATKPTDASEEDSVGGYQADSMDEVDTRNSR